MSSNINGEGNRLLTPAKIAAEALRLLKNNLGYTRLASRRYEGEFDPESGDSIEVRVAPRIRSATGRVLQVQPIVNQTVVLKIDQHEHVGLQYTVRDLSLSLSDFADLHLKSGMIQLANRIDSYVARKIGQGAAFNYGTPGTVMKVDDAIYMNAMAEKVGHPRDGMSALGLDTIDGAKFALDLKGTYNEEMIAAAIRRAAIGRIDNLDVFRSANQYQHLVGPQGGTPLVNGASQSGSQLATDGWTAAAGLRLRKGDVFTIAGVYAINPQSYENAGFLQTFTVLEDTNSNGSGAATINIWPPLNDGQQNTVDQDGSNVSTKAYQTVTALPADNAPITVLGTADTTYRQGVMWHRDAFALAVPKLKKPRSAVIAASATDPDSGISLLLTAGYDIQQMREIKRIDVMWGGELLQPELAWRLWSAQVGS
jgi:hypothetical protein